MSKRRPERVFMRPGKYFRAVQLFSLCLLAASPLFLMAQAYPPNGPGIPTVALTGSAPIQEPPPNPPDQQSQWNMELVGHSDLQGRSAYQPIIVNENGRAIAGPEGWEAAPESARRWCGFAAGTCCRTACAANGTCFDLWGPRPRKFMMSPTRRTRPDLR